MLITLRSECERKNSRYHSRVDGEDVRLMLWDTAGQEEFDAITAAYYRGAHACVLAYSATDRDSFDAIPSWKLKVENECGEIPTVLVQNKMDLVDQCVIDPDEAERLGRALGCKLLRTSVKEDVGVMSVFRHLASRCLHEMRRCDDDYQDDLRLYSAGPRSPSVIKMLPNTTCAPDLDLCEGKQYSRFTRGRSDTDTDQLFSLVIAVQKEHCAFLETLQEDA
ncbi:RAS oncogene family member Rab23 isoform X4 [Megachile rotundata]|uniref:RAS oncogene family member Rab23 isoform X4 n=1 Tax=Megachile rotundata TaxID=143995 RepID=UPI003FD1C824